MKQTIFILLSQICFIQYGLSQCAPVTLRTDPATDWAAYLLSNNITSTDPYFYPVWKQNKFNWLVNSPGNNLYKYWERTTSTIQSLQSPFTGGTQPYLESLCCTAGWTTQTTDKKPDMNPDDGWELIKQDFGFFNLDSRTGSIYNYNLSTNQNGNGNIFPYFILLNKFTGKMRFIGYGPTLNYNYVEVRLSFPTNNVSALFSKYNAVGQPLDKKTTRNFAKSMAIYNSVGNGLPFFADFDLGYDPCACIFDTPIQIDFKFLSTATINLFGVTSQDFTTLGKTDSPNYIGSVWTDSNDNIKGGILNYPTIDDLQTNLHDIGEKYTIEPELQTSIETFKEGIDYLGEWAEIFGGENPIAKGLKAGSKVLSNFVSDGKSASANISATAMSGQLIGATNPKMSSISLNLPGNPGNISSLGSSTEFPTSGNNNYPLYNRTPGVLALVETPEVKQYTNIVATETNILPGVGSYTFPSIADKAWQLNSTIKYTLNPAANISSHKLYGAIQIVAKRTIKPGIAATLTPYDLSFDFYEGTKNTNDVIYYSTEYVPIEALNSLTPALEMTVNKTTLLKTGVYPLGGSLSIDAFFTFETRVKLLLISNHLNNSGTNRQVKAGYTFPVSYISTTDYLNRFLLFGDLNSDNFGDENWPSVEWGNYIVSNSFRLKGRKTSSPGSKGAYRAITKIEVLSECSIEGEITLEIGSPIISGSTISPISFGSNQLTSYCNGTNPSYKSYSANQVFARSEEGASEFNSSNSYASFSNKVNATALSAHPNPLWSSTTFSYKVAEKGA